MKLLAECDGEAHRVEFRRQQNRIFAQVDSRPYELELGAGATGEYLLRAGTRVYECQAAANSESGGRLTINVGSRLYTVLVTDPKEMRGAQSAGGQDHGSAQVLAPMPGKIVRVLVETGSPVEAGQGLVVVEAMKMQNEMKSPKAGIVTALNATAGATVNAGDVLAVVQ